MLSSKQILSSSETDPFRGTNFTPCNGKVSLKMVTYILEVTWSCRVTVCQVECHDTAAHTRRKFLPYFTQGNIHSGYKFRMAVFKCKFGETVQIVNADTYYHMTLLHCSSFMIFFFPSQLCLVLLNLYHSSHISVYVYGWIRLSCLIVHGYNLVMHQILLLPWLPKRLQCDLQEFGFVGISLKLIWYISNCTGSLANEIMLATEKQEYICTWSIQHRKFHKQIPLQQTCKFQKYTWCLQIFANPLYISFYCYARGKSDAILFDN